jgi:Protein of unknown function (DUF1360)
MKFYWLVLGILTVWRITHLLQAEDGPWDLVILLRRWTGEGFFGKLLDCFYCLSVWVAVPFAYLLGESWLERALLWPSLSAAAILFERVTNPAPKVLPASFTEDSAEENDHGMLRQKEGTNAPGDSSPADRSTD